MSEKKPLIIIGLDSADPNLIELWLNQGRLPFLSSLIEKGVWSRLSSIASEFPAAPWLSFNTGVLPGQHGSYNYLELERGTVELKRKSSHCCRYLPFWSLIHDIEKKIAIFDIPKAYPIKGLEGIQISAWGEEYPMFKPYSLPVNIVEELTASLGEYRHPREILNPRLISQQVKRYHLLMSEIKRKQQAIQFVMDKGDWDLFMTSFGEAHYGNHLFYHLFNQEHWAYDSKIASQLKNALPNIYSQLDASLANLLSNVSEEATILIISVHGIATNYSANHLISQAMFKLGFQSIVNNDHSNQRISAKGLWQGLRNSIPVAIRDFINDWIVPQSYHDKMHSQQFSSSTDWQKTKAFFLPIGHFQGFISINLKGREPYGIVEPGEEYDQLCHQIRNELMLIINPETGKSAIEEVIKVTDILQGENLYQLPDLIIKWTKGTPINQLYHPKFGAISGQFYGLRKTQHTGEGFILATGKKINQSAMLTYIKEIDLAPTILYLLGESIPSYMKGRVLLELINDKFKEHNEVEYEDDHLNINEVKAI